MNHSCQNCGNHYKGSFCNLCGQKHNVQRFTFRHILAEVFHAFTHADKGVLPLIKKMVLNPGELAYEYIVEGKRKKYFNLFTFFVLVSALSAFVGSKELSIKEELFQANNYYGQIFNIYSKILSLVTIPVVAFFIWAIHSRKSKFFYSEYMVFAMILATLQAITDIVTRAINYCMALGFKKFGSTDDSLFYAIFMIVFIAYANYGFHKKVINGPVWQSLLTGITVMLVQVGIAIFMVWAYIRNFNGLGVFRVFGITISE